jgi:hypothetical protein
MELSATDFLRARIGELDAEGLRAVEWPPSARLFPERSRSVNEALQQVLREANGSLVTTMSAGRLWLRNCIANYLSFNEILHGALCSPHRAVAIVASGPSLESAAPFLHEARDAIDLWALPSSAQFLAHVGLRPDLFIMTDPGYWALFHFHHASHSCPVAMPLSAARGLWRLSGPLPFLLAQPGVLEAAFLQSLGQIQAPFIAPHGTVASTAIDLAKACTKGPIILAGLDLCTDDLVSHAKPNEFETFSQLRINRTAPCEGIAYGRAVEQGSVRVSPGTKARAPLPLRTYAGWLGQSHGHGTQVTSGELYRLFPSAVPLPGMVALDAASFRNLVRKSASADAGTRLAPYSLLPSHAARMTMVSRILGDWRKSISQGIERMRGPDALAALADSPVSDLSYQLAARQVLETKRLARLGKGSKARESAVGLLEECRQFLLELEERALNAV